MGAKPRVTDAGRSSQFATTFAALRDLLLAHRGALSIDADRPGELVLTGPYMEKYKRDLWFGGVKTGKSYVSYHLMPVYMFPDLLDRVGAPLRKRMQGKSCFNFTAPDPELFAELDRLTARSVERLEREGLL